MIISRTPFRISFFGGGTDYPGWYMTNGGEVLVTSINKYCYLTCRRLPPFFPHRFRIVYVRSENACSIDDISHPAVRGILRHLNWDTGLEVHHDADLPARSGMASSSAFTVGLLYALRSMRGRMTTKRDLALESIHIEQNVLKETVGSQDQVSVAYGGFNHIQFLPGGEINVTPVTVQKSRIQELENHLMLFFTGMARTAASVAATYVQSIQERADELKRTGQFVREALELLTSNAPITDIGALLNAAWQIKRRMSASVSNSTIDQIYRDALEAGAVGGKILGAGGGGFVLFLVPPEKQAAVRARLQNFVHVPFRFETSGGQIIFYEHDENYADEDSNAHALALERFALARGQTSSETLPT